MHAIGWKIVHRGKKKKSIERCKMMNVIFENALLHAMVLDS
jgi:hypothetical protein